MILTPYVEYPHFPDSIKRVVSGVYIEFGIATSGSGVAKVTDVEVMSGLHRLANW